jgi:hypothetical protein
MVVLTRSVNFLFLIGSLFLALAAHGKDSEPFMKFIENKNQWPSVVHFSTKIPGGTMALRQGGFSYSFIDGNKIQAIHERSHQHVHDESSLTEHDWSINGHTILVDFLGANKNARPRAFGKSPSYYNYFMGNDPGKWGVHAHAYDGVLYSSFYNGIDLKIYSAGEHVKYDFIVAPGADASQIISEYRGAEQVYLYHGNLYIKTSLADIIEKKPFAYQVINGEKVEVKCSYQLINHQLSFCFEKGYDPCYELIIDPLLIFSTYSGSLADNWGSTATPGEHGTLYSSGVTNHFANGQYSGVFPATAGAFQTSYGGIFDIGILKYDSTGANLLYASYLGGSDSESPHSLVMNANEELLILGTTSSDDFPTTATAYNKTFNKGDEISHVVHYNNGSDIFIARISKDGSQLLASTYIGGTKNDGLNIPGSSLNKNYGDALRGDIITDDEGNVYVSSVTSSPDFPVSGSFGNTYHQGLTDALLLKMNAELSQIIWSTFLGGTETDASHTVKLDKQKNVFIAGGTTSSDFNMVPGGFQATHAGAVDGWIAKIAADGSSILNFTFTGTSSFDQVYFIDLNENEEVYAFGQTSGAMPVSTGVYRNANSGQFIQKFNNTLSEQKFSTVIGSGRGIPDISPTAFLVDECNKIYLAGWGGSLNGRDGGWNSDTRGMVYTSDALKKITSGHDFYFMVLTADASTLLYATYFGGNVSPTHVDGGTSRFDKSGIVYHAVCSGCNTNNLGAQSDFPTTASAWSRRNRSRNCNNAAFKLDLSSLKARLQTNSVLFDMPGLNTVCRPDSIVFQNFSIGGEFFEWDFGDGFKIVKTDTAFIRYQYKAVGTYEVKLKAFDKGTCKAVDSVSTVVHVYDTDVWAQNDDEVCGGSSYQLKAGGGALYEWKASDDSFQSADATPIVNPSETKSYFIRITEDNGCIRKDTVQLTVIPSINTEFALVRENDCLALPYVSVKNLTDSLYAGDQLFFDFGDGVIEDQPEIIHHYENDGNYRIKLTAVRDGEKQVCVYEAVSDVSVFTIKYPNVITPGNPGLNDFFTVQYGKVEGVTPADVNLKTSLIVYNRWGDVVFENKDYQYNWNGDGLSAGIYFYEVSVEGHATCKSWLHIIK